MAREDGCHKQQGPPYCIYGFTHDSLCTQMCLMKRRGGEKGRKREGRDVEWRGKQKRPNNERKHTHITRRNT